MAYTPINWQTGDTITADKLNKMDNGWGFESTQLFSETVTTVESSGMNRAELAYSGTIDFNTITVVFNGTEYACPRIDAFGEYFYGGFTEQGPVFTEYPFAIESNGGANAVYTETAGTYTVAVAAPSVVTSSDFSTAVNSCIPTTPSVPVIKCIENETSIDDVVGKLTFFTRDDYTYIIVAAGTNCTVIPEPSGFTAHFGRDSGLFYISES